MADAGEGRVSGATLTTTLGDTQSQWKIATTVEVVGDVSGPTVAIQGESGFVADVNGRDLALFYLFLAVQECIDIAAHWVSDDGWAAPDDAGSSFDVLAERGVITHTSADALRGAVGPRNRIAHGYAAGL